MLVQHLGQDYRGMPVDAAREMGVPAAATPLINYITVAEQVWAFILNWLKRLPALEAKYGLRYVEWDAIFAQSDILSVQLALNDQTQGIIGAREIGLMQPTSLFIN